MSPSRLPKQRYRVGTDDLGMTPRPGGFFVGPEGLGGREQVMHDVA